MIKSVKDLDYYLWDVIDLDTGKPIKGVQWVDDETGELERLLFKNEEKDELLCKNGNTCSIREQRNIKLVKKEEE